mmetsp:Transcript_90626/g.201332  ORF Transcript_90626/g.201332 Transcript_90626/m.201332 type:complete len:248 (+) Transcript_90626:2-745(+)
MVIHTALAAQCAQRFAEGCPLVLAGDWNFKPGAAPYQLLTTGRLSEAHPAHPGRLDLPGGAAKGGAAWGPEEGLEELRSAYAVCNPGGEPEFTNYAWVKDDQDPFIGTLDYIFVSKQAEVVSVGRLPAIRACPSPLPTRDEPSDHLMLSAVVRPYGRRPEGQQGRKQGHGLSRPAHTRQVSAAPLVGASGRARGFGGGLKGRGLQGGAKSSQASMSAWCGPLAEVGHGQRDGSGSTAGDAGRGAGEG